MARKKKNPDADMEQALAELKEEFETLMLAEELDQLAEDHPGFPSSADIDALEAMHCDHCGWSGSADETFNDEHEMSCPHCGNNVEFTNFDEPKENTMSKLSKLNKVNENISINRYDNGWMVEVGGRDADNDWKNAKILCNTEEEMIAVIKEWNTMDLDS